jgi:hypothetical protein
VPDDDRFPRALSPAWRKVRHGLEGGESIARLTGDVVIAMADTVRRVGGVRSLPGIAARMQHAAISGQPFQRRPVKGRCHVPTEIAEQTAAALAATIQEELALVSPAEAALLLARRVLDGLACHYGFDRMVQGLIKDAYGPSELRAIFAEILSAEPVSALARRFVARPDGLGLRAPARHLRRLSAVELLSTPLEDL